MNRATVRRLSLADSHLANSPQCRNTVKTASEPPPDDVMDHQQFWLHATTRNRVLITDHLRDRLPDNSADVRDITREFQTLLQTHILCCGFRPVPDRSRNWKKCTGRHFGSYSRFFRPGKRHRPMREILRTSPSWGGELNDNRCTRFSGRPSRDSKTDPETLFLNELGS